MIGRQPGQGHAHGARPFFFSRRPHRFVAGCRAKTVDAGAGAFTATGWSRPNGPNPRQVRPRRRDGESKRVRARGVRGGLIVREQNRLPNHAADRQGHARRSAPAPGATAHFGHRL